MLCVMSSTVAAACAHRSVGVSNFRVEFLEELRKAGRPTPSVNQIELHGCCTKNSYPIIEYCNEHGITVMGWAPIARGKTFDEPLLSRLSKRYRVKGLAYGMCTLFAEIM